MIIMHAKFIYRRWGLVLILILAYTFSYAQKRITGTILSENNQPASGATVTVSGTQVATQTDATGKFSLTVPAGKNTLTVTSVGYDNQTINVANLANVNLTLKTANAALEQVV